MRQACGAPGEEARDEHFIFNSALLSFQRAFHAVHIQILTPMRRFLKPFRRHLRHFINLWRPLRGAGIRITRLDPDFLAADVELRERWWNRNYVGVHFGGSLYAMTDAMYMLMLLENLGPGYIVWDKAASIRYRKPGRGTVRAEFRLTRKQIDDIRAAADAPPEADVKGVLRPPRVEPTLPVIITDAAGDTVAEVQRTLHVRRK
jgi:acyl-coenzyme A thioesterase PaaI-like protein